MFVGESRYRRGTEAQAAVILSSQHAPVWCRISATDTQPEHTAACALTEIQALTREPLGQRVSVKPGTHQRHTHCHAVFTQTLPPGPSCGISPIPMTSKEHQEASLALTGDQGGLAPLATEAPGGRGTEMALHEWPTPEGRVGCGLSSCPDTASQVLPAETIFVSVLDLWNVEEVVPLADEVIGASWVLDTGVHAEWKEPVSRVYWVFNIHSRRSLMRMLPSAWRPVGPWQVCRHQSSFLPCPCCPPGPWCSRTAVVRASVPGYLWVPPAARIHWRSVSPTEATEKWCWTETHG